MNSYDITDRDEYYSPNSFRFTERQIEWLLAWLPHLRRLQLTWPPNPKPKSGYVELKQPFFKRFSEVWHKIIKRPPPFYEGKWENTASILGNLENRLCLLKLDGLLIKAIYCWHEDYETLVRYTNLPKKVLIRRVEDAFNRLVKK